MYNLINSHASISLLSKNIQGDKRNTHIPSGGTRQHAKAPAKSEKLVILIPLKSQFVLSKSVHFLLSAPANPE